MRNRLPALLCCLILFTSLSFAQGVSVNPLTGSANVVIPIYTVTSRGLSLPISISYNGSGVKTKDVEGTAGMGWQLNAGGQVTRDVRGLPDDCTFDNIGVGRYGWMTLANTGATWSTGYIIQNNGSTCSLGQSDISNINSNAPFQYDTEPDIFYVDAPGLSLKMIFNRGSRVFDVINYQDVVITYTTVGGSGNNASQISSFTITNNQGVKYVFAAPETVTETTTAGATPAYFPNNYNKFVNGITYYDAWNLVSITDANGNAINLNYNATQPRSGTNPVQVYINGDTLQTLEYSDLKKVTPQILASIGTSTVNTSNTELYFTWNYQEETTYTGQTIVTQITGMGRTFNFAYNDVTAPLIPPATSTYARAFLYSLSDIGCSSPNNYTFGYSAVDFGDNTTTLADSTSTQVDYWGYFSSTANSRNLVPSVWVNPSTSSYPRYAPDVTSTPGSAYTTELRVRLKRTANASSVVDGSLTTISNAQGGTTTITYQSNDYYDVPSAQTILGGGVRVQQITSSPGAGATNTITRTYSYVNSSGQSTGNPVTLPQFAFTVPPSTNWTTATILSAYDLATEDDHTIMYSSVAVSQTGAGKIVYNYHLPAMYWNTSATPVCSGCNTPEWYPSVDYAATYACPGSPGLLANLTYSYPFAPDPNYDFERGLPLNVITYNDNGNKSSETDYTYSRSYSPSFFNGFKSDDIGSSLAKSYSQYKVYYNTSELTASVTKTIYDLNGQNPQTSSVNYTYGGANYKVLKQQVATNSDNSTVTTNYTYVKDYTVNSAGSNPNINALYNLQQLNINAPVESYQEVNRGTSVYTSANLTLFAPYTFGSVTNYLPITQRKMIQPDGASSFTPFSINTSAQTIAYDTKYFITDSIDSYNNTGYPQTTDDGYKHIQTSYMDQLTKQATVAFSNANYNEVAFNDFDSQLAPNANMFTISGSGSFTPVGSHAGNAAGLATTQTVTSSVITKNAIAQNYIFSIWVNNTNTSAATLTFSGASSTITLSIPTGGWNYYEMQIPYSKLPNSTFTLSFTSSQNISIDDILLYPDVSEATTATFDPVGHYKIAQTNTNGVSAYFTNDQWGRVVYAYDQDKNIVLRKRFVTAVENSAFVAPVLSVSPTPVYHGIGVSFSNSTFNVCPNVADGVTALWTFGGSSPVYASPTSSVGHTFAANGTYTVTETLTSPLLGTRTGSMNVTVTSLPYTTITYTNSCTPGGKIPSAIATVKFLNSGGTVVYTFTTTQLAAGVTVAPAAYTIQITPVGTQYNSATDPTGYSAVVYVDNSTGVNQCFPFTTSLPLTVTDDLTFSRTVSFQIQPTTCN